MPAIISEQFRILNAETFVQSFVGVGSTVNKYYAFMGLPNSIEPKAGGTATWATDTPSPLDGFEEEYGIKESIIAMKKVTDKIVNLCMPAYFYFIISVFSMIVMMIQNLIEGKNVLCLGEYKCETKNAPFIFVGQALYILLWTYVLDLLCKKGLGGISWIIVLFPFILMFILIGLIILNGGAGAITISTNDVGGRLAGGSIQGASI